jgi:hypothetical protein
MESAARFVPDSGFITKRDDALICRRRATAWEMTMQPIEPIRLRTLLRAAATAAAIGLVASCGGSDDAPPAPNPAPGPAPAPAPAPGPAPGPAPAPTPAPIAQTAAGEPEGLPTFATIGAAGGTLASSDGRLTVSVPAGALAADTEVGIQPITATAPGALGMGYRLTPAGTTFAQPVALTFRYSPAEAGANVAQAMDIGTRNAQGRWELPAAVRDTAQRTVSITTTHFSDWSLLGGMQLAPAAATVAVSKKLSLRVVECGRATDTTPAVARECRDNFDPELQSIAWSVNGIVNGDGSVGTVSGTSPATYTAPAAVPAGNPVAVSAQVRGLPTAGRETLVSNVTVVDGIGAYSGTFSSRFTSPNGQSQLDANVRFTLSNVAEDGTRTYVGTGTARLSGSFTSNGVSCTWRPANGDLMALSHLIVVPPGAGPLANRYQIGLVAQAMSVLHCPGSDSPGPLQISHGVGADLPCPLPLVGDDASVLRGPFRCELPAGNGTLTASWTLRAE